MYLFLYILVYARPLAIYFYLAEASFVPKTLNRVHNKLQYILNVNGIFREKKTLKKTTNLPSGF